MVNVEISGDTRYDRVLALAVEPFTNEILLPILKTAKPIFIAGSTWLEDDEVIHHYCNTHTEMLSIIAPHHIDESRIKELQKLYPNHVLYTDLLQGKKYNNEPVIILNVIGTLSKLYRYATVNYIGGGFGADGVHNVLEAAVYGKPIIHGDEFEKFLEAKELVRQGGTKVINSSIEFEEELTMLLENETYYQLIASNVANAIKMKSKAVEAIMQSVRQIFF